MNIDKTKQLVQLYNRSVGLLNSLRGKYGSNRSRDVATRYNILRADVRRFVNDPSFDRMVPPAWCFKPFVYIPLALLILSVGIGLAYFLLDPDTFMIVILIILFFLVAPVMPFGGVTLPWLKDKGWFSASTINQVEDRADMLHQYLEDYISLNPDFASRIQRKDERRLEHQLKELQSDNLELEEELEEMEHELGYLKEQIAELRQRESIYLSIIKEAQTSATYSPSPKDREILLDSYRHQRTILLKNLTRYQEAKAQHGLNVPVDILNAIDQTQEDLRRIDANITALEEASKT